MKNQEMKQRIIEAAIDKQQAIIGDFKQRISEVKAGALSIGEEQYDTNQQSLRSETMEQATLLNEELEFCQTELNELKKIDGSPHKDNKSVHYGSLVKTDRKTFFVSASIEEFIVDGMSIFGLSVNAPLYQAMKGKKPGDSFLCENQKYVIHDIF